MDPLILFYVTHISPRPFLFSGNLFNLIFYTTTILNFFQPSPFHSYSYLHALAHGYQENSLSISPTLTLPPSRVIHFNSSFKSHLISSGISLHQKNKHTKKSYRYLISSCVYGHYTFQIWYMISKCLLFY